MASINFYLDLRRANKDNQYPLKLSISQRGKSAYIPLNIMLLENQWNKQSKEIVKHPNKKELNSFIIQRKIAAQKYLLEISSMGGLRNKSAAYIRDFIQEKLNPSIKDESMLIPYMEKSLEGKRENTQTNYITVISHIKQFDDDWKELTFDIIDKHWVKRFTTYLEGKALTHNTIVAYIRILKAAFNSAIEDEITKNYPFRKTFTSIEETKKRSLTAEELRLIFNAKGKNLQHVAIDAFKLIFFLIGINVADLCDLTAITKDGRIEYKRLKTNKRYSIKVEPEALEIINTYKGKLHLLYYIEKYESHRKVYTFINYHLKAICENLQIDIATTYWARHTWATIAHKIGIDKDTISMALGHAFGVKTTDIYIDYNADKIDIANRKVIDYILYNKE